MIPAMLRLKPDRSPGYDVLLLRGKRRTPKVSHIIARGTTPGFMELYPDIDWLPLFLPVQKPPPFQITPQNRHSIFVNHRRHRPLRRARRDIVSGL